MRLSAFPNIAAIVEAQTLTIDFGPRLPVGVILIGTPIVTLTTLNGDDVAPQSRLVGTPIIGTAPAPMGSGIANGAVLFQVADCQAGTTYGVSCYCTTSAGDVPEGDTSFLCYTPD